MKSWFFSGLAASFFIGTAAVSAAPFNETQTQIFTQNGQDFTFEFDMLEVSDGTGGSITIGTGTAVEFPGFDLDTFTEFFAVAFDGIDQGQQWNCFGAGGNTPIPGAFDDFNGSGIDCEFSLPFVFDGATLDALIDDGSLIVDVNFSDGVSEFGELEELVVTLAYTTAGSQQVSEPASLAVLGMGLVGLGFRRRWKN